VELNLSESDGGEKKESLLDSRYKQKKYTYMGVRKRLKNRKKAIFPLHIYEIYELCNILH